MGARSCLATLLLSATVIDGLALSPRLAAVRVQTQRAARRTPAAAAAARMALNGNGTNAVRPTGLQP